MLIKVRYYLLYFTSYFAIVMMLMFLVEKVNVGKKSINLMLKSALLSRAHKAVLSTIDEYDVYGSGQQSTEPIVMKRLKAQTEDLKVKAASSDADRGTQDIETSINPLNASIHKVTGESEAVDREIGSFIDYLSEGRKFLGCSDVVYPMGYKVPFSATTLQPGLAEDFLLSICNNHSFLSGMFCAKGERINAICLLISIYSF